MFSSTILPASLPCTRASSICHDGSRPCKDHPSFCFSMVSLINQACATEAYLSLTCTHAQLVTVHGSVHIIIFSAVDE